ncbi:MAG: acyltransferase [Actinoplanes sp.]
MTETKAPVRPAATSESALRFRPDVEGLRAVAVILVVLFHAGVPGVGGGYLGVDVFLVISGFLITSQLLAELDLTGRLSLLRFAARRARRILPVASLVLVSVVLVLRRGDEIAEDGRWAALFAADFRFAGQGDLLAAPSPLQHFWALAVEAQFFLIWPAAVILLVWLGFRWALGWFLAVAVAASFACSVWQDGTTWSYFSPATRAWELGVGCLLALAAGQLHRIPDRLATMMAGGGLALIVVSALTFDTFGGYAVALPVLGALLVLAGRGGALLGWAPLQYLGRLAYTLSLWHWPVFVIAEQAYGGPLPPGPRAALVLISLALATVTYVCVEEPIRRSGRLERSRLLTVSVSILLIAAPLAVTQ